ncbi:hypothetical protein [Actinosynnema mirum]|uniref:hypothetical protein n=1 Tax=Actinosynnema mirum TaxID=40567 RepID=UPI003CCB4B3E
MIPRPAILDVPHALARHLARLLHAERLRRGTRRRTRALTCLQQAVLGLRWLRDHTNPDRLARDHRVSRATAYRYLDEVLTVLANQAPDLPEDLDEAARRTWSWTTNSSAPTATTARPRSTGTSG